MTFRLILFFLIIVFTLPVFGKNSRKISYTMQEMLDLAQARKTLHDTEHASDTPEYYKLLISAAQFKGYIAATLDNSSNNEVLECARTEHINKITHYTAVQLHMYKYESTDNAAVSVHMAVMYACDLILYEAGKKSKPVYSKIIREKPNENIKSLPSNGQIYKYAKFDAVAPFTVITNGGERHFFVKLENWNTGQAIVAFFVRAGDSIKVKVPAGSFRLKYATGIKWLGEDKLFGEGTTYHKADKNFVFSVKDSQVEGYSVELFLQPNGNLQTSQISKVSW